jgi:hypothetical protein
MANVSNEQNVAANVKLGLNQYEKEILLPHHTII